MPNLKLAVAIAKAKVKVKRKRERDRAAKEALVKEISSKVVLPTPVNGKNGRDAPTLAEILDKVKPLLPETKIEQKTIVQQVKSDDVEDIVQEMLEAKLPEMEKSLRPKVELIREDVSDEKLEGFVSKKDFDDALKRIQDAITYHSGGGGSTPDVEPLTNILYANSDNNIYTESDLDNTKINIVHATVENSTITLPKSSPNYIVWVEDAVLGGGNITIAREA